MPVFDILSFARTVLKYSLIFGILAYMYGLSSLLGDAMISLWTIIDSSVDSLASHLSSSSNSSSVSSCIYFFIHSLGIDIAITSFLASSVGLLTLWASFVLHVFIFKFTLFVKKVFLGTALPS